MVVHGSIKLTSKGIDTLVSTPTWSNILSVTVYVFASFLSLELKVNVASASTNVIMDDGVGVTIAPST